MQGMGRSRKASVLNEKVCISHKNYINVVIIVSPCEDPGGPSDVPMLPQQEEGSSRVLRLYQTGSAELQPANAPATKFKAGVDPGPS